MIGPILIFAVVVVVAVGFGVSSVVVKNVETQTLDWIIAILFGVSALVMGLEIWYPFTS